VENITKQAGGTARLVQLVYLKNWQILTHSLPTCQQGRLVLENGDVYDGGWFDGRKHGAGVYSYSNSDEYDGEWVSNLRDGWGEYRRKGGGRIMGLWVKNKCVREVKPSSFLPDPMEILDQAITLHPVPLLHFDALPVTRSHRRVAVNTMESLNLLAAMIDADDHTNQLQQHQPRMDSSTPDSSTYNSVDIELGFYAAKQLLDHRQQSCSSSIAEVLHRWRNAAIKGATAACIEETEVTAACDPEAYRHAVPVMLFRRDVVVLRTCSLRCIHYWHTQTKTYPRAHIGALHVLNVISVRRKLREIQQKAIRMWQQATTENKAPQVVEVGIPFSILDSMNEAELAGVLEAAEGAVARLRSKVEAAEFDALLEGRSDEATGTIEAERADLELKENKLGGLRTYHAARISHVVLSQDINIKGNPVFPKLSESSNTPLAKAGRTNKVTRTSSRLICSGPPSMACSSDSEAWRIHRDKENSPSPLKSCQRQDRTKACTALAQRKALEKERAAVARITLRPLRRLRHDALARQEATLEHTEPGKDTESDDLAAGEPSSHETEPTAPSHSQYTVGVIGVTTTPLEEAPQSANKYTVGTVVGLDAVSMNHSQENALPGTFTKTWGPTSPCIRQEDCVTGLSPDQQVAPAAGQDCCKEEDWGPSALQQHLKCLLDVMHESKETEEDTPREEGRLREASCSPVHSHCSPSGCLGNQTSPLGRSGGDSDTPSAAVYHGNSEQVTYLSGDVYEGEVCDGQRHGSGCCTYVDESQYDGQWSADQIHGQGIYTSLNGSYDGAWRLGVQFGFGVFKSLNGGTFAGEWDSGERHGNGVYTYVNGDIYDGEWVRGMKTGEGVYQSASVEGESYTGQWLEGMKHGHGVTCNGIGDIHHGTNLYLSSFFSFSPTSLPLPPLVIPPLLSLSLSLSY